MQQIHSKLSIISKSINNNSPNSFEFNYSSNFQKPNFQVIEERKSNNNHELEFLIDASKFYSLICPALSSRLICKVANLTSEIGQTKSYSEFFSGKICPRCFSVYIMGINCKLKVKPIKGITRKRSKKKLLKLSKISSQNFQNYSFKHIFISCKFCKFSFKKLYWEKRINNVNKSETLNNTKNRKHKNEDILDYSNFILSNANTSIQNQTHQNSKKSGHSQNRNYTNNKNPRFFNTKTQKAGSIPLEKKNSNYDIANLTELSEDTKNEQTDKSSKGNSFYDIFSYIEDVPVIFIFGTTASGKTRLSVDIWKYLDSKGFKSEIINCDSMQLYKGFDVGTAKVSREIRSTIPHHLIDIFDINEDCTASKYIRLAVPIIDKLISEHIIPIIVGGTHMYLKALIWESLIDSQTCNSVNPSIKDEEYSNFTNKELLEKLSKIDPVRASSLHINDRRKMIRGIETYNTTGLTFTELTKIYPYKVRYNNSLLFWIRNKKIHEYIDMRINEMINNGLLKEVFLLKERLLTCNKYIGLLQGIAYKEFITVLQNKANIQDISEEELNVCIDNLRTKTLQYSKRQEKFIKKHIINRGLDVNILEFDVEVSDNQKLELLEFNIQKLS
ncbi:tRNA delta-isopentenylpyrophosphate transferase [Cryptosporidium sp. chipmunk genotype I]|uniref:tRNA delta-isopentenylpyrophosphate transferase n=1 Tax=Cryptosporidium sp. chipmunk genotype I TaxID=1280935 RepID=UPI00351A6682|nr:tRNA delta-isopentenylpyrophosphate transferase [Cryptosporidium sp. chipmunk genotype I]